MMRRVFAVLCEECCNFAQSLCRSLGERPIVEAQRGEEWSLFFVCLIFPLCHVCAETHCNTLGRGTTRRRVVPVLHVVCVSRCCRSVLKPTVIAFVGSQRGEEWSMFFTLLSVVVVEQFFSNPRSWRP